LPVIPVFEPCIGDEEAGAVAAAIRRGEISGSFGEETPSFEREFAEYVGARHGVAVTSGSAALHLAAAAAGIEPGDEVLVSASTHVSTALAPFHCGANPIPVDAEPQTGNLDLDLIESRITPRTKAIIPAHLFGHPIDMDRLLDLARRHGLIVIEDCAEAHGSKVRGRMAGSFGDMACFSFYANKVITTGEGGMVMTSDDALAERLRLLRDIASGTPRFVHQEAGFNFRMTGYQAAMGRVQLRKIEATIEQKRRVAGAYDRAFADVPGVQTPIEAEWARNVFWMYVVVLGDEFPMDRDDLMTSLRDAGIDTRTHFCPMNLQPFLRRQPTFRAVPCPVAERLWQCGLYLPSSITLSEDEIAAIVEQVRSPVPT
jgi:perosamine synthetase